VNSTRFAALPAADATYREQVQMGSTSPIDVEQSRELIREIAEGIPALK